MVVSFPTPVELKGAAKGTLLYVGLYMIFIQYQAYTKFYILAKRKREKAPESKARITLTSVKYYNAEDKLALNGDRTVGNFVEYAFAFLSLLWIHAVFVNPTQSFTIALLYTAFRSFYPIVFNMGPPYLFLSTVPGYIVLMYMMHQIASKFIFAD